MIAHVLRFKGRNFEAPLRIPTAQRRCKPAFASAACGAKHHDAARGHLFSASNDAGINLLSRVAQGCPHRRRA